MTTSPRSAPSTVKGRQASPDWLPLAAGYAVLLATTIVSLGQQTWSTEAGAHGPIVLTTGAWLLFNNKLHISPPRGGWRAAAPVAALALTTYIFGRAFDFISLEAFGVYALGIAFVARLGGWDEVRRNAFPLFYLGFIVPPPGWVIDRLTAPLQMVVSLAGESLTAALGYPVARQGVTLMVGSYQLLVEDACAGMNSIVGLTAVSLLYIYLLHRASWRYGAALTLLILPVAVAVNIVRVVALILITYHWGDAAAQGFLHGTTGIVLFGGAVLIIFALDALLWRATSWGRG